MAIFDELKKTFLSSSGATAEQIEDMKYQAIQTEMDHLNMQQQIKQQQVMQQVYAAQQNAYQQQQQAYANQLGAAQQANTYVIPNTTAGMGMGAGVGVAQPSWITMQTTQAYPAYPNPTPPPPPKTVHDAHVHCCDVHGNLEASDVITVYNATTYMNTEDKTVGMFCVKCLKMAMNLMGVERLERFDEFSERMNRKAHEDNEKIRNKDSIIDAILGR